MIDRALYMSEEDLLRLRAYASAEGTPSEWLLVDLATQTGLRLTEIAGISRKDCNTRECYILITRAKKHTQRPPEALPISLTLALHIDAYLQDHNDLWEGQRGRWTTRGMQQAWDSLAKRAGLIRPLSIKSARHTMAVRLLRSTKNLRLVQKQLGHESPTTTANLYAAIPFDDHKQALDDLFPKNVEPADEQPKPQK